jgi:UDP-N-acetylmuramate dehydrogenase
MGLVRVQHDVPLSSLTTMRVGGAARRVVEIRTGEELEQVVAGCLADNEPFFVLGGGSNVVARDSGFGGTIILNRIKGFDIVAEDPESRTLEIGAGEIWDDVVARSVQMNLSGIEALSAIPGTAGATPVQNVGAFGQEVADTLIELEAIDTGAMKWVRLTRQDCRLAYRDSIFKSPAGRHHIITSVRLKLRKSKMRAPFYASLQHHLDATGQNDYSPSHIRQAVIALRKLRLPDPRHIANCGSFFKNPIVPAELAQKLTTLYPDMPKFPASQMRVKLAAGWLIEQSGLKGYAGRGFATSPDNALVIINRSGKTYSDLELFASEIIEKVQRKFGICLEQEPQTL